MHEISTYCTLTEIEASTSDLRLSGPEIGPDDPLRYSPAIKISRHDDHLHDDHLCRDAGRAVHALRALLSSLSPPAWLGARPIPGTPDAMHTHCTHTLTDLLTHD